MGRLGTMRGIQTVLLATALAACAAPVTRPGPVNQAAAAEEAEKQRQVALQTARQRSERLNNVSFPLLVGAGGLCDDDVGGLLGLSFHNRHSYPSDYRKAATELFGVGEPLQLRQVIKGSPAAAAGLQAGDTLESINGKPVVAGDKADAVLAKQLAELKPGLPAAITLTRAGQRHSVDLVPVAGCRYPVLLVQDDAVNAFADGERVGITSGMLRFVENDEELALVIGHEIAHNAMGHIDKKKTNFAIGTIFDIMAAVYGVNTQGMFGGIGAGAYSQEFESEADYVGLYMAARSGYRVDEAPLFWRRMAAEHPGSIANSFSATHPATSERFVSLESTVGEIRRKREQGQPLEPELKGAQKQ